MTSTQQSPDMLAQLVNMVGELAEEDATGDELFDVVGHHEEIEVFGTDGGVRIQAGAPQPGFDRAPVVPPHQNDGEALGLARLNQGHGFKELVERS